MNEGATEQSMGIVNLATGNFTSDGTAVTVSCGFKPRFIRVLNQTDIIKWEKDYEQIATTCLKMVSAGTLTVDTTSAIVINTDGTVTISAAAAGTAKVIQWAAWG